MTQSNKLHFANVSAKEAYLSSAQASLSSPESPQTPTLTSPPPHLVVTPAPEQAVNDPSTGADLRGASIIDSCCPPRAQPSGIELSEECPPANSALAVQVDVHAEAYSDTAISESYRSPQELLAEVECVQDHEATGPIFEHAIEGAPEADDGGVELEEGLLVTPTLSLEVVEAVSEYPSDDRELNSVSVY